MAHQRNADRPPVSAYLLRDIPRDLWDAVKHRAVDDETSLRGLIVAAIREYLDRRKK